MKQEALKIVKGNEKFFKAQVNFRKHQRTLMNRQQRRNKQYEIVE